MTNELIMLLNKFMNTNYGLVKIKNIIVALHRNKNKI